MKTVFYDVVKKQIYGGIRNGQYIVDGIPGVLPENTIELKVITNDYPTDYDKATQYVIKKNYIDVANKQWVNIWVIQDHSPEHLENINIIE